MTPSMECIALIVERYVLPLLAAFAAGLVIGIVVMDDHYADQVARAKHKQTQAQVQLARYAKVCPAHIDWPDAAIPLIY